MEEGLIEINPALYMTCRLCVEQKGKFQIMPILQKRIKYAFDIDIQLFDGFSQILCEQCKAIVMEMSTVKEKFQAKQAELRAGNITLDSAPVDEDPDVVEVNVEEPGQNGQQNGKSDSDVAPSTSSKRSTTSKKRKKAKKQKRKTIRTIASSSSEDEVSPKKFAAEPKQDTLESVQEIRAEGLSWKELYDRFYICRYCGKKLSFKNSMIDHVQTHNRLVKTRHKLARWHATVKMERFQTDPNLTGSDDIVVLSHNMLYSNNDSADFFILYTARTWPEPAFERFVSTHVNCDTSHITDSDSDSRSTRKRFTCVDVTSEGDETCKPKLRKRIRVQSSDSVDTLDLQGDSDTVNVDESSNDVYEPPSGGDGNAEFQPVDRKKIRESEYNTIKKIVSASLENIKKKIAKLYTHPKVNSKHPLGKEELLKRKLLSIGRKTMVKRGYVSMGLLKVLEQQSIKILWVNDTNSKDAIVRIITKFSEDVCDNLSGFQKCEENEDGNVEAGIENMLRTAPWLNPPPPQKLKPASKLKHKTLIPLVVSPLIPSVAPLPPLVGLNGMPLLPALPHATLTKNAPAPAASIAAVSAEPATPMLLNLLNASPVANPKKAPKKKILLKVKDSKSTRPELPYNGVPIVLDSDDEPSEAPETGLRKPNILLPESKKNDNVLSTIPSRPCNITVVASSSEQTFMPIITATTSLAVPSKSNKVITEQINGPPPAYPRIKCKPVSELMGSKKKENAKETHDYQNIGIPDSLKAIQSLVNRGETDISVETPSPIPAGHIILHTITLPNTVTKSPFDYFSRLLRMHTLNLMDSLTPTDINFVTLVKFKLGVHQHPLSVMLCLTLEASNSVFRIIVKNKASEEVDVTSMTALWQWEVLKAFNSESVITRIKQAAEKEPSVIVNHANLFIGLLSSIKIMIPI